MWAIRIFKTRTQSTDACKRNWIILNNSVAKPSRVVRTGDIIKIKYSYYTKSIKVIAILEKRVAANMIINYVENLTSAKEIEKKNNYRKSRFSLTTSSTKKGRP